MSFTVYHLGSKKNWISSRFKHQRSQIKIFISISACLFVGNAYRRVYTCFSRKNDTHIICRWVENKYILMVLFGHAMHMPGWCKKKKLKREHLGVLDWQPHPLFSMNEGLWLIGQKCWENCCSCAADRHAYSDTYTNAHQVSFF